MGLPLPIIPTPSSCNTPRVEHLHPEATVAHQLPLLLLPLHPPPPRHRGHPDSLSCPPQSPSGCLLTPRCPSVCQCRHPSYRHHSFHPSPHCRPSPSPLVLFLWSPRRPLARWAPPPPFQNHTGLGVQRLGPSEAQNWTEGNSWAVPVRD